MTHAAQGDSNAQGHLSEGSEHTAHDQGICGPIPIVLFNGDVPGLDLYSPGRRSAARSHVEMHVSLMHCIKQK